eukprot:g43894.t1
MSSVYLMYSVRQKFCAAKKSRLNLCMKMLEYEELDEELVVEGEGVVVEDEPDELSGGIWKLAADALAIELVNEMIEEFVRGVMKLDVSVDMRDLLGDPLHFEPVVGSVNGSHDVEVPVLDSLFQGKHFCQSDMGFEYIEGPKIMKHGFFLLLAS